MAADISVVMSVYNGADHVSASIDSILSQEGVYLELIIVNDGSTDGSLDILMDYAEKDARIRVIDQINSGLTKALIRGCDEACGVYIARQDADDVSLPGRLAKLKQRLDTDERLVFVSSWSNQVGPQGEVLSTIKRPEDMETATTDLLHHQMGPPGHGSVMFRKAAYYEAGGYRAAFYYAQDSDLWLRLGSLGSIAYVQEVLYAYAYDPYSISTKQRNLQQQFGLLGQACHAVRLRGASEEALLQEVEALRDRVVAASAKNGGSRQQVAAGYYHIASNLWAQHDSKATYYYWRAVQTYPLHVYAWIRLLTGWVRKRKV